LRKHLQINNRVIGPGHLPLVIVELGINHNGSLDTAKEMVDAAHEAGAELIKHQTHIVEDEMSPAAKDVIPGNADISIYDIMDQCALNEEDEIALKEYVESKGMIFISTPFSRAAADRLHNMNMQAYKIGSGECNNYPLIEHIAQFNKPIILSTGMNNIESVQKAVDILKKHNTPYALLHTTNIYPTPEHLVRLGAMQELSNVFEDTVFGLSDHTTSNLACLAAVAMGASIVERHFTDHKQRVGPDIINSMDKNELKELLAGIKSIHTMMGGKKEAVKEEQATIDFAFATVVAVKDIKCGDEYTKENLWVKRPGTGEILAEHYESILGKKANKDICSGNHICWGDISE